ncbi:hypothetical protein FKM82_008138 [Ascaphus truei]
MAQIILLQRGDFFYLDKRIFVGAVGSLQKVTGAHMSSTAAKLNSGVQPSDKVSAANYCDRLKVHTVLSCVTFFLRQTFYICQQFVSEMGPTANEFSFTE